MEPAEIEALAREAGFDEAGDVYWNPANNRLTVSIEGYGIGDELNRFAALVEAAAMEKAAKIAEATEEYGALDLPDAPTFAYNAAEAIRAAAQKEAT